jgi:hypothetical protein
MLFSNPRVLPALLLCIGLGIALLRGQELQAIPESTPATLERDVELNYAMDMLRSGQTGDVSESEKTTRKQEIREQIQTTFIQPRAQMQTEYRQGLWMAAAGAILMALVLILQQRGIIKK